MITKDNREMCTCTDFATRAEYVEKIKQYISTLPENTRKKELLQITKRKKSIMDIKADMFVETVKAYALTK